MPAQFHFLMVISIMTLFKCLSFSKISMKIVLFFCLLISAIFRTFVSMKQAVTDIADVLKSMNEKLGPMQKTIDSQHDTICNLNRNINKLNAELSKRNTIIEDLRKRLAKYETPDKNSNNSSTPPSKEKMKDEVVRRTKTLRKTKSF